MTKLHIKLGGGMARPASEFAALVYSTDKFDTNIYLNTEQAKEVMDYLNEFLIRREWDKPEQPP